MTTRIGNTVETWRVAGDEADEAASGGCTSAVQLRTRSPEALAQLRALDRLAAHQRDRLGMVGDSRDGEAEIGLIALLLEVERDQRPADQMREQRADARIGERGPRSGSRGRRNCRRTAASGVVADRPHRITANESR